MQGAARRKIGPRMGPPSGRGRRAPEAPPTTLALANTSFLIGKLTYIDKGGVRWSSPTLGLLASGTPVAWRATLISGTSNHFNGYATGVPVTASELSSPLTPQPSGSGYGNLAGTYVFSVEAQDAGGTWCPAKTFTITVDPNAASVGNSHQSYVGGSIGDVTAFQNATTPGQRRLLISSGADFGTAGLVFQDHHFTSEVKIAYADPARPCVMAGLLLAGTTGCSYITSDGLTYDGVGANTSAEGRVKVVNSDHIKLLNNIVGRSPASWALNFFGVVIDGTCDTIEVAGNRIRYHQRGVMAQKGANVVIRDNRTRYISGQNIYLGRGLVNPLVYGNSAFSPWTPPGDVGQVHPDFFQCEDDFGGYTAAEGGFTPTVADTGVTQGDVWRNNIGFNADARKGATAFARWRSGQNSQAAGFKFDWNILATNDPNGMTVSSAGPGCEILDNAIIKVNCGDFSAAPPGTEPVPTGPSLNINGKFPGNWAGGSMLVAGNFVGDDINVDNVTGYATPTMGSNTAYNQTYTSVGFPPSGWVNGDPRARLESKTFAEYAAMDDEEIIVWVMDSFRRTDDAGPVRRDGATPTWRTTQFSGGGGSTPKADSTTAKADSNLYKADAT